MQATRLNRNSTSRRLNSCLLIDNTATTAHLPGPQNPGKCHLYIAEGCHLYIALTAASKKLYFLDCVRLRLSAPHFPERRGDVLRVFRGVLDLPKPGFAVAGVIVD